MEIPIWCSVSKRALMTRKERAMERSSDGERSPYLVDTQSRVTTSAIPLMLVREIHTSMLLQTHLTFIHLSSTLFGENFREVWCKMVVSNFERRRAPLVIRPNDKR